MPHSDVYSKVGPTAETSFVPESYRPLVFACVGIWGWTIVLSILHWQHIDVSALLHVTTTCQVRPLFLLAISLTLSITIYIIVLEHTIFVQHTNIFDHMGPVVFSHVISAALIVFGPCRKECHQFLRCLYRLVFKLHCPVYFSDVIVADIFISFSGVFTGIFKNLMGFTNIPYSRYVPFVQSIPYLIRLKQCLNDHFSSNQKNKRHLINALKYITSIPVIFLAHYTHLDSLNMIEPNKVLLWRIWFLSAVFNSLFAFGWDIVMDWGLVQIEFESELIRLRKDIHFSDPFVYIMVVGFNSVFRLLKIASHLHHIHPFCVDLSEIVRRWIWVIFRLEHEWMKRSYTADIEKRAGMIFTTAEDTLHTSSITHPS